MLSLGEKEGGQGEHGSPGPEMSWQTGNAATARGTSEGTLVPWFKGASSLYAKILNEARHRQEGGREAQVMAWICGGRSE